MEKYYSLQKLNIKTGEIEIQKSRFLGFAKYIDNVEDATNFIKQIKQQYKDARHIVYGYITNGVQKSTDDGEPSGTAGKPILEYLLHSNINNIVVVVVRYFGGIKLGTGGLCRAYVGAVKQTLENNLLEYVQANKYCLKLNYKEYQSFLSFCKNKDIKITNTQFLEDVVVEFVAFKDYSYNIEAQHLGQVYETMGE